MTEATLQEKIKEIEYKKTLRDEIDLKIVDQLHGITAQMSNFCFETKKFCLTTETFALPFIYKISGDKLYPVAYAAIIIPIIFWLLDAMSYHYQRKIRSKMQILINDLTKKENIFLGKNDLTPTKIIEDGFNRQDTCSKILGALFNKSMSIYFTLFAAGLLTHIAT